jgi:hypothetical protein
MAQIALRQWMTAITGKLNDFGDGFDARDNTVTDANGEVFVLRFNNHAATDKAQPAGRVDGGYSSRLPSTVLDRYR